MPETEHCACGRSLGTYQTDLFSAQKKCVECQTKDRCRMILATLPTEDDWEWERLSEFEQIFLPSVRQQFAQKGMLSEKQYQVLESLWKKTNR